LHSSLSSPLLGSTPAGTPHLWSQMSEHVSGLLIRTGSAAQPASSDGGGGGLGGGEGGFVPLELLAPLEDPPELLSPLLDELSPTGSPSVCPPQAKTAVDARTCARMEGRRMA